jgi:hypothetical protein
MKKLKLLISSTEWFRMRSQIFYLSQCRLMKLKKVLDLFKRDKSPGPDGWTVEFFSTFFDWLAKIWFNGGGI